MRESRTYGSVRGARDEKHIPTATEAARVHHAHRRRGGEACCVKYFVIVPESGIKRRAMPRSVNMDAAQGRQRGGATMRFLVSDLLLFSCLAVLITGMVIVVASLLIS